MFCAAGPKGGESPARSTPVCKVPANAWTCDGSPGADTARGSPGVHEACDWAYSGNAPASSSNDSDATSGPQGADCTVMVPALCDGGGSGMPETQLQVVPPLAVGKLPRRGSPPTSVLEFVHDATTAPEHGAPPSFADAPPPVSAGHPLDASVASVAPAASVASCRRTRPPLATATADATG